MDSLLPIVFLLLILLKLTVCDGFCFQKPECKNSLPERIKLWKTPGYRLEIPGEVQSDSNLEGYDYATQVQVDAVGFHQMKTAVDDLIQRNRKAKYPDFTISKLDPISYVFQGKKMLITFTNVRIINLHSYDKKSAVFSQKGIYEKGDYELDKTQYENLLKERKKDSKEVPTTFLERITPKNQEGTMYNLYRRDAKWTIGIGAKFITKEPKNDKLQPITFAANFKIQPDKDENVETDDQKVLRFRGRVRFEFHDFKFSTQLTITHIDDPLRLVFPDSIKSNNLVPDLNLTYEVGEIKIIENSIRLLPYDKDYVFPKKIDEKEEVNANVPDPKSHEKQNSKKKSEKSSPLTEKPKFYENEEEKTLVVQHLKAVGQVIQTNTENISERLCRNLIPKMAWKVMHMETKKQLPFLFHEILAYEDDFNEKTLLEPFTAKASFSQSMNMVKGLFNWFGYPAPIKLEDEDSDSFKK